MFNLQLVLYQRSGKFVEPPISGPRGACIGMCIIVIAGGLVAFLGREHLAVAIIVTTINVATLYGCLENLYFYYDLLIKHQGELDQHPHEPEDEWRTASGSLAIVAVPSNVVLVLLSGIFLMQYPVEKNSYW